MVKVWSCNVVLRAYCCVLLFVSWVLFGLLLFCVIKIPPQASPCVIKTQMMQDCTPSFFLKLTPCNGHRGRALSSAWFCCLVPAVAPVWQVSVLIIYRGVLSQPWHFALFYYYPFLRLYLIFLIHPPFFLPGLSLFFSLWTFAFSLSVLLLII